FRARSKHPPTLATISPYTTLFRSVGVDRPSGPAEDRHGRAGHVRLVQVVEEEALRSEDRPLEPPQERTVPGAPAVARHVVGRRGDRKSTRLNSSHVSFSYAVFCLT